MRQGNWTYRIGGNTLKKGTGATILQFGLVFRSRRLSNAHVCLLLQARSVEFAGRGKAWPRDAADHTQHGGSRCAWGQVQIKAQTKPPNLPAFPILLHS